ncbi:MAG: hypothetical protein QNL61_11155 [Crocinitomicaceae bacterium]
MKKENVPQDKSSLENFTREVCYVKNKDGKYETELSTGWETKAAALENAWEEINRRTELAKKDCTAGKVSPIAYYLEFTLMDMSVLAGYTGFFSWQIKRHMKPTIFQKLSDKKLQKYASAFDVTVIELKNFNPS